MRIAIDGPAGAGKSTIARRLASELGYVYVDTGAMYRALTYAVLNRSIDPADAQQVHHVLQSVDLRLMPSETAHQGPGVLLDGVDVQQEIRQPQVTEHVSVVARHPEVRKAMVEKQRELAAEGNVVMDGRDIGTTVMPDAETKIFLQASVQERAKRRSLDLARQGHCVDMETLIGQIEERDHADSTRTSSPLVRADDAVELDTTTLSVDEVVQLVMSMVEKRAHV